MMKNKKLILLYAILGIWIFITAGYVCLGYFPANWLSDEINGFNSVCYDKIGEIQDKRKVVKTYLEENIWKLNRGGKAFCAYEILGEKGGLDIHQYLWVLCEEYYLENSKLKLGGGTSLPVAITLRKENNVYEVISHEVPGAGSLYGEDIERIFPKYIQNKIFSNIFNNHNQRVKILEDEIKKETEENPCAVCKDNKGQPVCEW